jgi:hypothetical protein
MTANLPTSLATIGGDDLAGDQPIDQHADGGQVLLDRRLLKILAERLDIGGDVERLDVGELAEFVAIAPVEEPHDGMVIGRPRVLVADGGGEEFEEAARGLVASRGDHARHHDARVAGAAGQRPGFGWHKRL